MLTRISTLVCACALALAASEAISAFDAAGQILPAVMGGGESPDTKPSSDPLASPKRDPAERSRSIECSQKADAQALQGKIRKHFLHQCKSGS